MKRGLVVGLALSIAVAGCGSKEEENKAEQAQEQAAQTAEQGAAEAAKGLEQMAKGLEALAGGGGGNQKPVDPVSFRDMMALFPDIDGWEKGKPTGERMASPFAFSTAEVTYTKGDSRIELKMTDSGFNQLLLTPYAMFLTAGYEKETADGYEKSVKVADQPGWEKWNSSSKDGELNALVGKRFLLQIEGSGLEDTKVLHDVAGKVDMGKLAGLK
jgi:hypothetical protein